jgi:cell shape-determining protein MreC
MKKIILVLLLIIACFFIWKYSKKYQQDTTPPEKAVDSFVNYVPNAIERKNTMEDKVSDSVKLENERLKKAMEEIQ